MKKMCRILHIDNSPDDRADLRQMLLDASGARYQFTQAELGSIKVQAVRERQQDRPVRLPFDIPQRKPSDSRAPVRTKVLADLRFRKDEFMAMLSHGLRTPLAAIFYALPLLSLQKTDGPMRLRARGIIERQARQRNHRVDDLLEVSRITTGRVPLRPARVTMGGIVTRAIETAQPPVTERCHGLAVSLPEPPLWLPAGAARLEQVGANLRTNAAKYIDKGGCRTTASALRPNCCPLFSTCSPRPNGRWTGPRVAWALACAWTSSWSKCMAARSAQPAFWIMAANSRCACP